MQSPDGHPFIAATLDWVMRPFMPLRERVIPEQRGRVLEIGAGTGLNFPLYDPAKVSEVVAIEPDPFMVRRAVARLPVAVPVRVIQTGAESLPFDDNTFDRIVCTFVLCTIPNLDRALGEMARVLKPDGELHFVEHTRADGRAASVQRAIDPLWGRLAGGCHLSRDPAERLRAAGFDVPELHGHGRSAFNLTPVHRGVARLRPPVATPWALP